MRRDYFTCVFLGLIAGALMFVCFEPLYFIYGSVVPREFGLFERLMSVLYAFFFIIFLPFFSAFRSKVWVNWGLAAYGVLIYLPKYFYPAEALIKGDDAKLTKMLLAVGLRGIYGMMQAPFAALSTLIGDKAASGLVYWILPMALVWPIVFKIGRFYRRAYLSEQLNPMPKVKPAPAAAHSGPAVKPEVLGTVITAPAVAASPDEVTGKAVLSQRTPAIEPAEEPDEDEPKEIEGKTETISIPLSAPSESAAIPLDAPSDSTAIPLSASSESAAIPLSAPSAKEEPEAISLSSLIEEDEASEASAPDVSAILEEGQKPVRVDKGTDSASSVIELGAPSSAPSATEPAAGGQSDDNVENNNDTL